MQRNIHFPFGSRKSATLFALLAMSFPCALSAATFEIEPRFYGEESIDVSIVVDGHEQCRITREAGEDNLEKGTPCQFSAPTSDNSIVVIGKYSSRNSEQDPRTNHKVEMSFDLVDFEPATSKLTGSAEPFGLRVSAFIKAARQFTSEHNLHSFTLEGSKPASSVDIEKAQKRLGYALPAELVSLLATIGEIREGDNSMTSVATITDSYSTLRHEWETDEADLIESYTPGMLELLKASTLLYTEVGDGYGGLLYRPPPTKACGDKGLYVWTSQEEGTESLSKDGACPNFERVFRWLLDRFVIALLADELQEDSNSVLIDSTTGVQRLQLSAQDYANFRFVLGRSWQEPIFKGE